MAAPTGPGLQDAVYHGQLGIVRQGRVELRYFVLRSDRLDYYDSAEEAAQGGEPRSRMILEDIDELEVLDSGFWIRSMDKSLELQVENMQDLQAWINLLEPILDVGGDGDGDNDDDDDDDEEDDEDNDVVEEEVILDGPLLVSIKGKLQKKHFWLLGGRLEFTSSEEEDEVQGMFPLSTISAASASAGGFTIVAVPPQSWRKLAFQCEETEAARWVTEIQIAIQRAVEGNSALNSVSAMHQLQLPPAVGSMEGKSTQEELRANWNGKEILCKSILGVLRKGETTARYFVLFRESFEYWSTEEEHHRGDDRRGYVALRDITMVEDSSNGFTVHLVGENQNLELRCSNQRELDMWLENWIGILAPPFCAIRKPAPHQRQQHTPLPRAQQFLWMRPTTATSSTMRTKTRKEVTAPLCVGRVPTQRHTF